MRILIAEDIDLMQKLIGKFLSPFGEISFVKSGIEALTVIKRSLRNKQYFDLISLDIDLPGQNGLEVLKSIRTMERLNHIPSQKAANIIMVSSTNDAKVVMQAIHYGCDGYLVKPLSKEKIINELKKLGLIEKGNQTQRKVS